METDDKVVETRIENGAPIAVVAKESFDETVDMETPENPERVENNNLNGNKNDSDSAIFTGPSNDNNTGKDYTYVFLIRMKTMLFKI